MHMYVNDNGKIAIGLSDCPKVVLGSSMQQRMVGNNNQYKNHPAS